jgi:uncharacterized cupin superfamily protein
MPVPEAPLEKSDYGLATRGEGWFVVDVREAAWVKSDGMGVACVFESDSVDFPQIGYTLAVLQPGEPNGMYHRESNQEDFLVLAGECLLLIEGEERELEAGDFVHCPPGTDHIFVGAGEGPCAIWMTGARSEPEDIVYPRNELALKHDAGVEVETDTPADAYARYGIPRWKPLGGAPGGELPW